MLTGSDEPYKVYTPYSKAWRKLDKRKAAGRLRKLDSPNNVKSLDLPSLAHWGLRGEREHHRAGREGGAGTADGLGEWRDWGLRSDAEHAVRATRHRGCRRICGGGCCRRGRFTSGARSGRRAWGASGRKGAETYVNELIWREFYQAVLWHWPKVLDEDFNPRYGGVKWPGTDSDFEKWKAGETGFPIVDAAMRQLAATGFMHNRCRMITAMFLTKDLHVHWRKGESYFMQQLTDGEIASNNGGWQWSAGTGADAAPYFRIQNPWTQGERFDKRGEYVREWVPELRDVDAKRFFGPPEDGKGLAKGYPAPMVDHREERERTLEMFKDGKD